MFSVGRHGTARTGVNRGLAAVGVLVLLAIAAVTAALISSRRAEALDDSRRATANLAQVLAEQTSRSMQTVDLTLREVAARLASTAAHTGETLSEVVASPATFDMLVDELKGLPQANAISIIGPDGRVQNTSRQFPTPPHDSSDRDYFRYFGSSDDHGDFVSTPAKSHSSNDWMVFLSRRINDAHGQFAGVVVAALSLSYLEDFYKATMPADGAVTVLRRDGTILVHSPHNEAQIGMKLPPDAPWYGLVDHGGGSYRSPGYVDGIVYLVSLRALRDFPLVVDVSQTEAGALAGWQHRTLWLLAGAGSCAAVAMVLLWAFDSQLLRLKQSEASLAQQNVALETGRMHFDAALDNISQGVTFFDGDQKLIVSNRRYREIYGLPPDVTRAGVPLADLIAYRAGIGTLPDMTADAYMARRRALSQSGKPFEIVDELLDGRYVLLRYQPLANRGWVTTHEDITERRLAEADLAFLARHDALTLLPNRTLFQERLAQALASTRRRAGCALLLLDLDGFKVVNDNLGHPVGDALLQAVAGRLRSAIREIDTVARLGGDEFALIQCGLESPHDVAVLAERVIASVAEPFDIDGHRVLVGASLGAAVAPSDGTSSETLFRNADVALYLAKDEGRGTFRLFEPKMDARVQVRRALELDLRDALANDAFALDYQPILELRSGRVVGFEALIRWNHPVRGLINPADFVPIAEDTGLIVSIGKWVLRRACLEAAGWPDDIGVSVNLSAIQFRGGQLLGAVEAALSEAGLAPSRLELEITESVLLHNSDDRLATLHRLRALGVRVALDDFGTGYSSLSYLRSFPFDKLKIDRCFIGDLVSNRESKVIVSTIIGLAVGLGMTVTAEGVELAEQVAILREKGCAQVQGDLFSPPLGADEALDWLSVAHPRQLRRRDPVAQQIPETAPHVQ
jgi:diguanylate cyclase (GGDEF)-like protein